ncbi:hypothetical protein E2562_014352 [Oryza meyeriana var. granulata]|uniref:Phytosulfokine n=1 Tax=Oryza meyeriana var. granulata TaxID=110450 RepID=A0A6G1C824_9ORYZ|nr:hypothetical protein E2562_014352 [Oryza meyeriana var. granulata]
MAPPRCTALLLVSLLLPLCISHAAQEAARSGSGQEQRGEVEEAAVSFAAVEEPCGSGAGGGEGEEDCLMRRTLMAHTDYIYTQGNHH